MSSHTNCLGPTGPENSALIRLVASMPPFGMPVRLLARRSRSCAVIAAGMLWHCILMQASSFSNEQPHGWLTKTLAMSTPLVLTSLDSISK
eukprot:3716975-Rhodomonas_salina.1